MGKIDDWRWRCRVGTVLLYIPAGVLHIAVPGPFLLITPSWVPTPERIIFITGICELCGAVGLWIPRWQRAAALALALYAVCVYPANIKHAMDDLLGSGLNAWPWTYHLLRLALQPVIAWMPLFGSRLLTWPFRVS